MLKRHFVNTETTKKAYRKAKGEVQGWNSYSKDLANVNDARRRGSIYTAEDIVPSKC
jgi:hypothetical protein